MFFDFQAQDTWPARLAEFDDVSPEAMRFSSRTAVSSGELECRGAWESVACCGARKLTADAASRKGIFEGYASASAVVGIPFGPPHVPKFAPRLRIRALHGMVTSGGTRERRDGSGVLLEQIGGVNNACLERTQVRHQISGNGQPHWWNLESNRRTALQAFDCEDVFKHAALGDLYAKELVRETARHGLDIRVPVLQQCADSMPKRLRRLWPERYLAIGCINCCRFVDPALILHLGRTDGAILGHCCRVSADWTAAVPVS